MPQISRSQSRIALKPNTAVFGTAEAVTFCVEARLTASISQNEQEVLDISCASGLQNLKTRTILLERLVDITLTFQLSYNTAQIFPIYGLIGNDTATVVDVTAVSHDGQYASDNDGLFTTLAYLVEDDEIVEIPSVKWTGLTWTQNNAGVAEVTMTGIGNKAELDAANQVNTVAGVNAAPNLSTAGDTLVRLGTGTNHYYRQNDFSGIALLAADNVCIRSFTLGLTRPMEREFALCGTGLGTDTQEPSVSGNSVGSLSVEYQKLERTEIDLLDIYDNTTEQKIEIFQDGDDITGSLGPTKESMLWQFPRCVPKQISGIDLTDNTSKIRPTVEYELLASITGTGPTGMATELSYATLFNISDQTAAYV